MKKLIIALVSLAVLLITGTASAVTVDLIADGGSPATEVVVGTVEVTSDGTDLVVEYNTSGGWEMTATHLGVKTDAYDGINAKTNGNVSVGKMAAGGDKTGVKHDPAVTTYTYTIALEDVDATPGDPIEVAAHAKVRILLDPVPSEPPYYREESGWG